MGTEPTVKVFDYIPTLDAFVCSDEYDRIADELGIGEWNPVVWIGRLFSLDNDFGEHWMDNFDEQSELQEAAWFLGYDVERLMLVVPRAFADRKDGPCHTDEQRKAFWTDVLKSLHLSLDVLFAEARAVNECADKCDRIRDLEKRINRIRVEKLGGVIRTRRR